MAAHSKEQIDSLSQKVIGAAYEVANVLGIGFIENVYKHALVHELMLQGVSAVAESKLEVPYKGVVVGNYSPDILVENQLIIELKCVNAWADEHVAQCLNYLKATDLHLALLINFQRPKVEIKRIARNL